MSDMKCPFCQQELKYESEVYVCRNPNCKHLLGFGSKELWQELIRTRKALDVAVDALNKIKGKHDPRCAVYHIDEKTAYDALEQITALEQKEEK